MMSRHSNYDKYPYISVCASQSECWVGWREIVDRLMAGIGRNCCVLCVECYPGASENSIRKVLEEGLRPVSVIYTPDLRKPSREVDSLLQGVLGDDPVFGRMSDITLQDFFEDGRLSSARENAANWRTGLLIEVDVGAALVCPDPEVLVYADMARWEIQGRQRRNEIPNLGPDTFDESPSLTYKRAFFVDWRAADRLKKELLPRIDFLLDTNKAIPKLVSGDAVREGLTKAATRPFRVVPYFDPGPWGGHWMEEICDLPNDAPNHAWCFDCVPEENSLLLAFASPRRLFPAIDLTFLPPHPLRGYSLPPHSPP